MIIEWMLESFFEMVASVLGDVLGSFYPTTFISNLEALWLIFTEILSGVFYFLPVTQLIPLIVIVFSFISLKIVIAIVRLVLEVLPL